jgi:starch synthase (maltosyl-transferring)
MSLTGFWVSSRRSLHTGYGRSVPYEPKIGRIPIRDLSPLQPEDRWPTKAFVGEVVPFEATVFKEGHDQLGAQLLLTAPDGSIRTTRMVKLPIEQAVDRWHAVGQLDQEGTWTWRVRAFLDEWLTWLHNAEIKVPAGVDVELMFQIGAALVRRAGRSKPVQQAIAAFSDPTLGPGDRLAFAMDPKLTALIEAKPLASLVTDSELHEIRVERTRAGVGSWYEFFPRSIGAKQRKDGSWISGTFRTAAKRLPEVKRMGFDVIYLPPVHPIGRSFRKGPNNTLNAGVNDPGSPWAIGAAEGGHDTFHPDLGDERDFAFFVEQANRNGLEVALDLAFQCSPDHPWVTEHPEWFTTLPDGSIAYAENPPKKYQDIYPLNFDNDWDGLTQELLRVVRLWIDRGVKIFRVDNPHTKPLRFWEWLIHEVNAEHPDVIFFAEAFTRPPMMQSLGQIGFQQSYTYFTWRNTKQELAEYLTEVSKETSAWFRPNFFVNTPDILTEYLQFGGRAAYKIRAALAATASPSWGVYSGYELFEDVARPGSEENIDNEKYEYKPRDFAAAEAEGRSLAPYLRRLNEIRAAHPALRQLRNLDVHWSDDDAILVFTKYTPAKYLGRGAKPDGIIVVVNVDPHSVRETTVHLDLTRLGLPHPAAFQVTELITGKQWTWGVDNYVRLDAYQEPVHILSVEYPRGA